jgi:hypothetical protein
MAAVEFGPRGQWRILVLDGPSDDLPDTLARINGPTHALVRELGDAGPAGPAVTVEKILYDADDPAHSAVIPHPQRDIMAWLMGVDLDGRPLDVDHLPDVVRRSLLPNVDDEGADHWFQAHAGVIENTHERIQILGKKQARRLAVVAMETIRPPAQITWQFALDMASDYDTLLRLMAPAAEMAWVVCCGHDSADHLVRALEVLGGRTAAVDRPIDPVRMARWLSQAGHGRKTRSIQSVSAAPAQALGAPPPEEDVQIQFPQHWPEWLDPPNGSGQPGSPGSLGSLDSANADLLWEILTEPTEATEARTTDQPTTHQRQPLPSRQPLPLRQPADWSESPMW